jgi:transketolase
MLAPVSTAADFQPARTRLVLAATADRWQGISGEASSLDRPLGSENIDRSLRRQETCPFDGKTSCLFRELAPERYAGVRMARAVGRRPDHEKVASRVRDARDRTSASDPSLSLLQDASSATGAPHMQDSSEAHGAPIGPEETMGAKLQPWDGRSSPPFLIPTRSKTSSARSRAEGGGPPDRMRKIALPGRWGRKPRQGAMDAIWTRECGRMSAQSSGGRTRQEAGATREHGRAILPEGRGSSSGDRLGGCGDLAQSTFTVVNSGGIRRPRVVRGRNLHFGSA